MSSNCNNSLFSSLRSEEDSGLASQGLNDKMKSFDIRNEVEAALEVLYEKKSELYETSNKCLQEGNNDSNYHTWDELFETVERFSQNTLMLLSWVDEFKEVQTIKFNEKRMDKRSPVDCWSESTLKHADRIFSDLVKDADRLLDQFSSEKNIIKMILRNAKKEYESIAAGWWGSGLKFSSFENDSCLEKIKSSKILSDLEKLESLPKPISSDVICIRLWWKLVQERERWLNWINSLQRKIDTIESYYPTTALRQLYEQYLIEVREYDGFNEEMMSLVYVISNRFPEMRYRARCLLYDVSNSYNQLESNIRAKLIDLPPENFEKPHPVHVYRPYSPSYRRPLISSGSSISQTFSQLRNLHQGDYLRGDNFSWRHLEESLDLDKSRREEEVEDEIQLSDFSFNQIRDNLKLFEDDSMSSSKDKSIEKEDTTSEKIDNPVETPKIEITEPEEEKLEQTNTAEDRKDVEMISDPVQIAEDALQIHRWLKNQELNAIEDFSSKSIGWDPKILSKFLVKNQMMQEDLSNKLDELNLFEESVKTFINSRWNQRSNVKIIDENNLYWTLLMLKQRHSTLNLFCLDVQCLLERRFDAVKLLEKNQDMKDFQHPPDNLWSELAIEIKTVSNDKDYDLLIENDNSQSLKSSSSTSSSEHQ